MLTKFKEFEQKYKGIILEQILIYLYPLQILMLFYKKNIPSWILYIE